MCWIVSQDKMHAYNMNKYAEIQIEDKIDKVYLTLGQFVHLGVYSDTVRAREILMDILQHQENFQYDMPLQ